MAAVVLGGVLPRLPGGFWAFLAASGAGCLLLGEGANGIAEQDVEGLGELAGDAAVVFDEDLGEEDLVEAPSEVLGGSLVGGLDVGGQGERQVEVVGDQVAVVFGGGQPLIDLGELAADALLLGLE